MERTIGELLPALEAIAPLRFAESWDNVGLLVDSHDWPVRRALLTIDLTPAVLKEALDSKANLIVAYHPPIFSPLKQLTSDDWKSAIILNAAANRIAIYSPHTALDAAHGGVNDWLIGAFGKGRVRPLKRASEVPVTESLKLVTFCPESAVNDIRSALALAGAGRIGEYSLCSFELRGTGTFHGSEAAQPVVGQRGRLERADEVRLEMVCPSGDALAKIVAALRSAHPYDEPAFEIHALQSRPLSDVGLGRTIEFESPRSLRSIVEDVKRHLKVDAVKVAIGDHAPKRHSRAAACAGAGGSMLVDALHAGAQVFLTGEMRYHDVLDARARGCTILLAGHSNTERGYMPHLKKLLGRQWTGIEIAVSRRDRYPMRSM